MSCMSCYDDMFFDVRIIIKINNRNVIVCIVVITIIISTIINATKKAGIETIKNSWDGMIKTGEKVKDTVVDVSKKMNPFKKEKK